jgi:hypothetical protein
MTYTREEAVFGGKASRCFASLRTAENSERTANVLAVLALVEPSEARISAANEISLADILLQEQQKQRKVGSAAEGAEDLVDADRRGEDRQIDAGGAERRKLFAAA